MVTNPTHEILLEEKINWTGSFLEGPSTGDYLNNEDGVKASIELKRNLRDDTFDIIAKGRGSDTSVYNENMTFSVNNKQLSGVVDIKDENSRWSYTAHRNSFENVPLSKITEIGANDSSSSTNEPFYYSVALFPEIAEINNNITMKDGDYLHLKSLNSIKWSDIGTSISPKNFRSDINSPDKTYNDMYIVPRKFDAERGNKTLFDIYCKNDDKSSNFADFSKENGKMFASTLNKTGLKTHFQPMASDETISKFKEAEKVGEVQIFDNQFYNYDSKKVEVGYGKYAEQGLLVPYDFSGEFKEQIQISPNSAFQNLNINMSHIVDQPLLSKYDGKVILNIEELPHDQVAGPFKIIPSEKISMLADNDPSIKGLERISFEEAL